MDEEQYLQGVQLCRTRNTNHLTTATSIQVKHAGGVHPLLVSNVCFYHTSEKKLTEINHSIA